MPVTLFQRYPEDSDVSLEDPKTAHEWRALGSETPADIYAACLTTLPPTYLGMYLQSYKVKHLGGGVWDVLPQYGKESPLSTLVAKFAADTSGGTIHREHSFGTTAYAAEGDEAPDFGNLIGVTQDGVAGVDVVSPKFAFGLTKKFNASTLAPGFLNGLIVATGKVNSALTTLVWKGQILLFQEKELLFLGAGISDEGVDGSGNEQIGVAYKFEASPNKVLAVGDIEDIAKPGWDYSWVRYQTEVDGDFLVKVPQAVYIEEVYEATDFTALGV